MPTCFIGFLPAELVYIQGLFDFRLFSFLLSIPLVFIGPRSKPEDLGKIPGIRFLFLIAITVILRAIWSLSVGIPFFDVMAVIRWNFTWPIYTLCVLHYISRLPVPRLYSVLRVFLIIFSIQVCLAAVSVVTGVDFFLNKNSEEKSLQYIRQGLSVDNLRAFPIHIFIGTAFLFISLFKSERPKRLYYVLFFLALALPLLYTRRMYALILFLQTFLIYFFVGLVSKKTKKFLLPAFICVLGMFAALTIAPGRIDQWVDKIVPVFTEGIDLEEVKTYEFRLRLLEDAIDSVNEDKCRFLGMGYMRDINPTPREGYSYVLGEDSFVAPVIYCEGWSGLVLRVMPYLVLLGLNLRRLWRATDMGVKLYAAVVIGVIVAQIPAYLQTAIICRYDYFYLPLVFVELIIIKKSEVKLPA